MSFGSVLIYILFAVPILASFTYFTGRFQIMSKFSSLISVITTIVILAEPMGNYSYFNINSVNRIILISVSVVYSLGVFYASIYHSELQKESAFKLHFSLMHIFVFTMYFSLLINNYGLMWIGIEATTASSALLLIIEGGKTQIEAAWRYAIIVSAGLTLAILPIILIYLSYGTLTASTIISEGHSPELLLSVAGVISLVGFGTKIGIFPMHTWLPDAHGEAPSEISAMFSGILLPVASYVLYRFYEATFSLVVTRVYIIFIMATIVFVAMVMPSQRNIKRMFAYSTMENMAIITLGLISGGIALIGALLIIITHAFAKSGAFFSSGNIFKNYGTKDMNAIRGLRDRMPGTAAALIVSSLMVSGTPPFTIFVGELLIIYSLILTNNLPSIIIIVICLFIISISMMNKVTGMVFDGNSSVSIKKEVNNSQLAITIVSVALAISIIFVYLRGVI